jgi:hypothetical protein
VAAVGAIALSLLYIAISLILTGLVGRALSRSGRAFLDAAFAGQGGTAEAASRLLVVAFYLLSLGFIALTVPSGSHVTSASRGLQLLSGRLGILLLVLGALHVTSTLVFARLRRSRSLPYASKPGAVPGSEPPAGEGPAADEGRTDKGLVVGRTVPPRPAAGPAPTAQWRPRPPRVVH